MAVSNSDDRDIMSDEKYEVPVFVFYDFDGTVDKEDSGQQLFDEAGICSPEEYFDIMSETHVSGWDRPREGGGNELLITLDEESYDVDDLREAAKDLEPEPRDGIIKSAERISDEGYDAVLNTAGVDFVVDAKSNGHFDAKLAGELGEDGREPNGNPQKPASMVDFAQEEGVEKPVHENARFIHVGDGSSDIAAYNFAARTYGGVGLDINESYQDIRGSGPASVYTVDDEEHEFTAALLYHLVNGRDEGATEDFVDEKDLDVGSGYAFPGELSENPDEIKEAAETVRSL